MSLTCRCSQEVKAFWNRLYKHFKLTEMVTLLSKFERLVVDLSRAPRGQTRDSLGFKGCIGIDTSNCE